MHILLIKKCFFLLKHTGRNFFKIDEFDGPCLAHRLHGIDDVVLQRVDPVLLVQPDRPHGLLAHGTLVGVSGTLKLKNKKFRTREKDNNITLHFLFLEIQMDAVAIIE